MAFHEEAHSIMTYIILFFGYSCKYINHNNNNNSNNNNICPGMLMLFTNYFSRQCALFMCLKEGSLSLKFYVCKLQ